MPLCYTNLYLYIQFPFQPSFRVVWVYNIETSFTYILFQENMPLCHKAQIWPDIYCDACKTLSDFLLRLMLHELGNTCCVISCCLFEIEECSVIFLHFASTCSTTFTFDFSSQCKPPTRVM